MWDVKKKGSEMCMVRCPYAGIGEPILGEGGYGDDEDGEKRVCCRRGNVEMSRRVHFDVRVHVRDRELEQAHPQMPPPRPRFGPPCDCLHYP